MEATTKQRMRAAVAVGIVMLLSFGTLSIQDNFSFQSGDSSPLQEQIEVPQAGCEATPSTASWIHTKEVDNRVAAANSMVASTLRGAMRRIITEINNGQTFASAWDGVTEVSARKTILKTATGSPIGTLILAYPSAFVNVGHLGTLRSYRDFSGRALWSLDVPRSLIGTFGEPNTVAIGEAYYDPTSHETPAVCLTQELASQSSTTRTFVGRAIESASGLFLLINATSLPSNCVTYSAGASVICPAQRTASGTPISVSATLDLKTSGGTKVGKVQFTGTVQGYSSTGYVKCITSAACKSFGNYYAPYKYYESTIVNAFTEGTLKATATISGTAQAYATLTLLYANSPNITIPWCTAMAAFIECFANLSLMADATVTVTASGSITVVITPIQKTTTKAWTTTSGASDSSKVVTNAITGNVTGMNTLVSTIKLPRFTTDGSLTMQTKGGAIGASAGLTGTVWGQVILNKLTVTSKQACGSLDWKAKAWVSLPYFPTIQYSDKGTLLKDCMNI